MYLATLGRTSEAIIEARRALDLDPLSPIVNADLGWHLLFAGQRAEAIEQFRKTLEFDVNSVSAHQDSASTTAWTSATTTRSLSSRGRSNFQRTAPSSWDTLARPTPAQEQGGDRHRAEDLQALATREYVPSSAIAAIYTALGDHAHALDWLEKADEEHDFSMAQINVAPWFEPLRKEERFQRLLSRLGMK